VRFVDGADRVQEGMADAISPRVYLGLAGVAYALAQLIEAEIPDE
jgi:hypothetical protein